MSIIFRKHKILIAVPLVLLLLWIFLRRHSKPAFTTCNQLFSNVHKYVKYEAFENREESFVGVWASSSALEKESCSFYTFRRKEDTMMLGYKTASGEITKQNVDFRREENGVISYYHNKDPTKILGYIYPLYFDDFPTLGNVECTDKNGFAEWKATIAVPLQLLHNHATYGLVGQVLQTFQKLAPQLGVDIHQGDFYGEPCWQPPTWGIGKFSRKNNSA